MLRRPPAPLVVGEMGEGEAGEAAGAAGAEVSVGKKARLLRQRLSLRDNLPREGIHRTPPLCKVEVGGQRGELREDRNNERSCCLLRDVIRDKCTMGMELPRGRKPTNHNWTRAKSGTKKTRGSPARWTPPWILPPTQARLAGRSTPVP